MGMKRTDVCPSCETTLRWVPPDEFYPAIWRCPRCGYKRVEGCEKKWWWQKRGRQRKAINGLECCILLDPDDKMRCSECPYNEPDTYCLNRLKMDVLALLKAQESPENASISSAIECLLHPQDADDSDMAKAIDTAVRAMRSLRDQEPRVMQFSEIMEIYNADPFHIWPYDTPPYLYIQEHPHVRNSSESWAAWREIRDIIEGELFGHTAQSYGKTWRCWTAKPTREQREATPWQ